VERFCIDVINATPNPQQVVWAAMHQDYSEDYVWDSRDRWPPEQRSGELIVKHLLAGDRGHYGCLEHPQITFNVGYFPHSMMQQVRTHRVGVSFDVQCLAANTEVTFVNDKGETSKEVRTTIGELYELWTNGEKTIPQTSISEIKREPDEDYKRKGKSRIRKMNLRVLNEDNGLFETGTIKDVIYSGIQPIYRVTLADGKTLDCTVNHRLFTAAGWQTMGDAVGLVTAADGCVIKLTKSCSVMCNGIAVASNREPLQWQSQLQSTGTKIQAHPVKVINVEYLGEHKTYDLEVDGQWHNFVANGMVVHNSFRYTGQRIINVAQGKQDIEEVFYLRPVGNYTNRQGKRYFYSEAQRNEDLKWCLAACQRYQQRIEEGLSEEHARGLIPFDARQNFVLSCNMRSLMHLLDLRWKKDAQLEAQKFCELLYVHFEQWSPAVAQWYKENRAKKAKLSP
jgi:thymidylate synthase (FAD)